MIGKNEGTIFRIFANNGGLGNNAIESIAKGLNINAELIDEKELPNLGKNQTSIVWGILRGSDRIIKQSANERLNWFHVDHAYVERGHEKGNYRLSNKFINSTDMREVDNRREKKFKYKIEKWSKGGSHVLVCPPSTAIKKFLGVENWITETIEQIKSYTDREIRIRDKKSALESGRTLAEDMKDCHAVVTHLSNIAIDAVLMGVPVFVNQLSSAWHVSGGEIRNIEKPNYPDRELWLNNLLYQQFNISEFETGEVWKIRERWLNSKLVTARLEG